MQWAFLVGQAMKRKAEDVPEITPEMINAGATVLQDALYEDLRLHKSAAESLAERILLASLGVGHNLRRKLD